MHLSLGTHEARARLTLFSLFSHASCLTTDTHWYSGDACDWGIQKSLVYGLVGAGVAVLLVVLIILAVFSFRYRREAQR